MVNTLQNNSGFWKKGLRITLLGLAIFAFAITGVTLVDDSADAVDTTTVYNLGNNVSATFDSSDHSLTISSTVDNGAVPNYTTTEPAPWNVNASSIYTLTVETKVATLGNYAFNGLTKLKSATFPDSYISIGEYTFNGCSSLMEVDLTYVTNIGSNAFKGCTSLSKIVLGGSVSISSNSFDGTEFYSGTTSVTPTTDALKSNEWVGSGTDRKLYKTGLTNEWIITFNGNDASATVTSNKMTTVNQKLPSLPKATKDNRVIQAWYTASTGGNKVTTGTHFESDKTLYANWADVSVTGVSLNRTTAEVYVDSEITLVATVAPSNATNKNVVWSVDNDKAFVDQDGCVTGLEAGTAVITVTTEDGNKTASCTVTVKNRLVTSLTLDASELVIGVGTGQNATLRATVLPDTATDQRLSWEVSNDEIITASSMTPGFGNITGQKTGTATVTVKTMDGSNLRATCQVTVVDVRVSGITMDATRNLDVGYTLTLVPVITPENADVKKVTWTSSDPSKATVDSNGKVTGIAAGTVVITATTVDRGLSAQCTITLTNVPVDSVTLDPKTMEVEVGKNKSIAVTILPANASDKTVTWTSSDNTIATVDSNGKVTGIKNGSVTITAGAGGKSDTCAVSVITNPVEGVKIDAPYTEIMTDSYLQLTANVIPATATDKTVIWTSSNEDAVLVDSTGLVYGAEPGTSEITVTTRDGSFTDKVTITVTEEIAIETEISETGGKAVVVDDGIAAYAEYLIIQGLVPVVEIDAENYSTVDIPSDVIEKLALLDQGKVSVIVLNGGIEIPFTALSHVYTAGDYVGVSIVSTAVPEQFKDLGIVKAYSVSLMSGVEAKDTNFGTKVTAAMKYTLADGEKTEDLRVAYLPDKGNAVNMSGAKYIDGYAVFETDHVSTYAILFKEVPQQGADMTLAIVAAVIIVIVAVIAVIVIKRPDLIPNLRKPMNRVAKRP